MGSWGTGIFDDDTALDVRTMYLEQLIAGSSNEQATDAVMSAFEEEASDEDYAVIVWMAIAATQWEAGRLQESVKKKTLELLEQGDSPLWQEQGEDPERAAALAELKAKLNSPQPQVKEGQALKELLGCDEADAEEQCCSCCHDHGTSAQASSSTKKWWEFWK